MSYFPYSICKSSCHHVIMLFRATNACTRLRIIPYQGRYSVVVKPPACLSFYTRTYQYITSLKAYTTPPSSTFSTKRSAPLLIKNRCTRNPSSGPAEASTFPVRLLSRSASFRWRTRQRWSASPCHHRGIVLRVLLHRRGWWPVRDRVRVRHPYRPHRACPEGTILQSTKYNK